MKLYPKVRTIEDLEMAVYGGNPVRDISKADDPYLTTTTGIYQVIYGAKVWSQLNQKFNAFAVLPKKVWDHSGFRMITARAAESGGGTGENSALPETIKPTYLEVYKKPSRVAHSFDVEEMLIELAGKDDVVGNPLALAKEETGKHHMEMINRMLLQDVDTAAGNNFESIDRVCSGYDEWEASLVDTNTDVDLYGQDRHTAASILDAYVDENAGTDRDLSLDMIDTAFATAWERGGDPKVIITGYDTLQRIQQLTRAERRFVEPTLYQPTMNGVQPIKPGVDAGFMISTYNGVPIIPSKDVQKDTISRIYILDTDYLFFKVLRPTQYFESGIKSGDPFAINKFAQEGLYRTMGELICTFPYVQSKIRDLQ